MQEEQLKDIAGEDLDDLPRQIEKSFAIRFAYHELEHVKTFGELCDIIESKIPLINAADCTSQQAFYKVRKVLKAQSGQNNIIPSSPLVVLLPKRDRKQIWRSVKRQLNINPSIIGPSPRVVALVILTFLSALAAFFISASAGGIGLAVATLGAIIAGKTGNTLQVETVRELIEKMTREQYVKSRRDPATFNRREVTPLIKSIFMDDLAIPASALHRDATFS